MMCGIYGAIALNGYGKGLIQELRPQLEQTSKLRGRDGHGSYEWSNGYLGVSRAQPLPEGEKIPLPLQSDHLVMVFNGTISNDEELRQEFSLPNADVDTYTALALWQKLGWEACNHFVGGYAFGVYNEIDNSLTIAKNFKTLWYIRTKELFAFASEKEFLLTPGVGEFHFLYPRRFPQNTVAIIDQYRNIFENKITRKFWSFTPDLDDNKAVVVTSGGIDSVTSAHIAKKLHNRDIHLINFDYGQRAATREMMAVAKAALQLGCPAEFIDIKELGKWGVSPLTDCSIELPLGRRSVESTLCWTPGRNMLMISYAAAFAEAQGAKWIYYGNNLEEEATGYSDNDLEFIYLFNDLLDYGTLKGVKIRRALGRVMKTEILQIGNYLGVNYADTWSCDEGGELPCGICGCCTTRQYAFKRAGLIDEQKYLHPIRDKYPWDGVAKFDIPKLISLVTE